MSEHLIIGGPMDGSTWVSQTEFSPRSKRFPESGHYILRKYRNLDDTLLKCWVWTADMKGYKNELDGDDS
jgi:hypothetical protein